MFRAVPPLASALKARAEPPGADHAPLLPSPRPPSRGRPMSLAVANIALLCAWLLAEVVPLLADALARREAAEREREP